MNKNAKAVSYKVIYHSGESIGLQTNVKSGRLSITQNALCIEGESKPVIPLESINSVEFYRLQASRMIKIVHADGVMFVSVIRVNLFGYFAIGNYFGTGKLHDRLQQSINP